MSDKTIFRLHEAVAAVCPIDGVALPKGKPVRVDHKPEASIAQRAAAQAVVAGFNWTDPPNQDVAAIDAFALLANPSQPQIVAQVKRLGAIAKLTLQRLGEA